MHVYNKLESIEVEILDDEEIDKYLENVMSIEKEVECLKCEKRAADIINKSRRVRKIKNNRQQQKKR